jgi:transposase
MQPLGFPLIVAHPKGRILNAEYYRDNIFAALTQFQPEDDRRKLVVHADNARAHTAQKCRMFCKENGLRLAPHPPYSPDLLDPTSFCSVMSRNVSKEWCFHHTRNYSTQLVKWLTVVFEHWMERLEWVSKNNDDYYP